MRVRTNAGAWAVRAWMVAAAALVAFTPGTAGAARPATPPGEGRVDADADAPSMFPKGTWDLQFYGTYLESIRDSNNGNVATAVAAAGYYFGERHSFRMEVVGYGLDNKASPFTPEGAADDAIALGANIGLRYQFLEHQRLTLFVEGYAGFFYGHRDFPEEGTHFNFNQQFGLGATFRLGENVHLVGGARYMHISNAQIRGQDENPSFDGIGGYAGLLFTF